MRVFLLTALLLSVFLSTQGQESTSSPSRRRSQRRRNRIQSLLQEHSSAAANARFSAYQTFSRARSPNSQVTLPPIFNQWLQYSPPTSLTTTTTPVPDSPASLWYYKDDSDFVQGPYNSFTMLEWHKAGYFRQTLLVRRQIDDVYMTLAGFTKLYRRVPFTNGEAPGPLSSPATTTTTTATTTTTTATTTTTTEAPVLVSVEAAGTEDVVTEASDDVMSEEYLEDEEDYEGYTEDEENEVETEEDLKPSLKDGTLRLTGGRDDTEGNVEMYHLGIWGSICDDEWDGDEAKIVCKALGFPGFISPTHGSRYGYSLSTMWLDNMYCYGTEKALGDCRHDGWGIHDCERTEAAGVKCKPLPPPTTPPPPTTTPKPKIPMDTAAKNVDIRLVGGRVEEEGRIELKFDDGPWGVICGDGWGVQEGMVACRQLGLDYLAAAFTTHQFGGENLTRVVSGLDCKGNEESFLECGHDDFGDVFCPGELGEHEIAAVVCTDTQADLEPDLHALISSAHLEDKQLFLLQCAMEENCLAKQAYHERRENPYWNMLTRRLFRFTTSVANIGSADFLSHVPKSSWQWHACHQHYHSMETFAHFEIIDPVTGHRAAEGHKASFCLEDNDCHGVDPKFSCADYGDQGITPGCKDIYYHNIDCQWIDVTELPLGNYIFKMTVNPEYKIPETTFENNAGICSLVYTQMSIHVNNCTFTRP